MWLEKAQNLIEMKGVPTKNTHWEGNCPQEVLPENSRTASPSQNVRCIDQTSTVEIGLTSYQINHQSCFKPFPLRHTLPSDASWVAPFSISTSSAISLIFHRSSRFMGSCPMPVVRRYWIALYLSPDGSCSAKFSLYS